jgi:hypothetical protein
MSIEEIFDGGYRRDPLPVRIAMDPGEPDIIVETPWEDDEPMTVPEEWPERVEEPEKERDKEKAPVGAGQPCPMGMDPGEPEIVIETPWEDDQPMTVPEEWPEPAEVPEKETEREREKVPATARFKTAADEEVPYAYAEELYGWKILNVSSTGKLSSPTYFTEWPPGKALRAKDFDPSEQVRGRTGIHTVDEDHWQELHEYMKRSQSVLVKLKLMGRTVVGDNGVMRSEGAKPVLVVGGAKDKELLLKVANLYGVDIEVADSPLDEAIYENEEEFPGWSIRGMSGTYKGFDLTPRSALGAKWYGVYDEEGEDRAGFWADIDLSYGGEPQRVENISELDADPEAIPFLRLFFESLPYKATYARDEEDVYDRMEYQTADWRDSVEIDGPEDLNGVYERLGGFSWDDYYYEWDGDDLKWDVEGPDEFGIYTEYATLLEPLPPEIEFDPDTWLELFFQGIDDVAAGRRPTVDPRAMIEVPRFILEEPAQAAHPQDPNRGTDSHEAWKAAGGMVVIDRAVRQAEADYAEYPEVLDWLKNFQFTTQIPGQMQMGVSYPTEQGEVRWPPENEGIPGTLGHAARIANIVSYAYRRV